MDFCYNTRLSKSNSMIFKGCIYLHMGNILYKYGWNRSYDNKFMNLYLTVCPRTSKYFQWNSSSPKGTFNQISNNALPHQQVNMHGKVVKIWNFCGHSHWFYKRFYIPTTFLFFRKKLTSWERYGAKIRFSIFFG